MAGVRCVAEKARDVGAPVPPFKRRSTAGPVPPTEGAEDSRPIVLIAGQGRDSPLRAEKARLEELEEPLCRRLLLCTARAQRGKEVSTPRFFHLGAWGPSLLGI